MKRGTCRHVLGVLITPVLVALALALAWPGSAAGADADELIKEGVGLRRKGDDLGALQRFEQAFQLGKTSRALAQMGLAEQALGRWVAAYEHLTQALESKTDAWIGKNRPAISEALNVVGEHVGRLEIIGGSPGAEVRLDGVIRGTLPLPAPLTTPTGTITIDVSTPGFFPVQRTTTVRARQTTRESLDPLVAIPGRDKVQPAATPVTPAASTPVGPAVNPSPQASPSPVAQLDAASGQRSSVRSAAKWIAWGLGGAALGVGLFGYFRQSAAGADFNRGCGIAPDGTIMPLPGSSTSPDACRELSGRTDSGYRMELIGLVSAGVLAGTGFVLWLTEPKPAAGGAMSWVCAPGMTPSSGPWLGCRLRF